VSLFERFAETKEEGFREEFIQPLLVKLGFVNISNKHGTQEFGKDYVFSEIDRFAHYRHMVVQAKHEESINQGRKVDDLLSQVRQAFNVPYHLPSASHEQRRVSAVYVFNSGTITENAQTQIRNGLDPALRTNVHFFDGEQLSTLDNSTALRFSESIRERLASLNLQLGVNATIIQSIAQSIDLANPDTVRWDVRQLLLRGIEDYVAAPLARDHIQLFTVLELWQQYSIIRAIVDKHYSAVIGVSGPGRAAEMAMLKRTCEQAFATTIRVVDGINNALGRLPAVTI
jgi:hypothetical protein